MNSYNKYSKHISDKQCTTDDNLMVTKEDFMNAMSESFIIK
jgi:hypothetical protein